AVAIHTQQPTSDGTAQFSPARPSSSVSRSTKTAAALRTLLSTVRFVAATATNHPPRAVPLAPWLLQSHPVPAPTTIRADNVTGTALCTPCVPAPRVAGVGNKTVAVSPSAPVAASRRLTVRWVTVP